VSNRPNANGQETSFTTRVKLETSASATAREFIPRLWATRPLAVLFEKFPARRETSEILDEVHARARKFAASHRTRPYRIFEDEQKKKRPGRAPRLQAGERIASPRCRRHRLQCIRTDRRRPRVGGPKAIIPLAGPSGR